jgi:hypothetical protein
MSRQLNLFACSDDVEIQNYSKFIRKKRIRYAVPTYKKKYKIFVDAGGRKQDEMHIYRYRTLYVIYGKLVNYSTVNPFSWNNILPSEHKTIGLLRVFKDTYQSDNRTEHDFCAEIVGTGKLSFKERLLIHIRLLRLLKQGIELQRACRKSIKYWYKLNT